FAVVTFQEMTRPGHMWPWALAGVAAILVWLAIFGVPLSICHTVSRALRKRLKARADNLANSYGPVFEQWGGLGFLNDRQALKGVIAELYGAHAVRWPDSGSRS